MGSSVESTPVRDFSLKGLHPLFYQELTAHRDRGVVWDDVSPESVRVRGEWYWRLAQYSLLPPDLSTVEVEQFLLGLPKDAVAARITELAYAFYEMRVNRHATIVVTEATPPPGEKLDAYVLNEFDRFLGPIITEPQKNALYWWTFNKFRGPKDFLREHN